MSTKIAWLEQFTGIALADDGGDLEHAKKIEAAHQAVLDQEAAYERKRQAQQLLLAQVRAELNPIKAESRTLLSSKIPSGPFKGKAFLAVDGEQIDEIDPDALRMLGGGKKRLTVNDLLPGDIGPKMVLVVAKFEKLGARLSQATFDNNGTKEPLFSTPQVQAEYWTPLKLERVYPDGLMLDRVSETQQMVDATNQLYLEMCEQKKLAGQLTPESDLVRELMGAGKDIASLGGEILGTFAGDTEGLKLAAEILEGIGEGLDAADAIYEQVKTSDYAGAAAGAIDIAGKLVGAVLGKVGVPNGIVTAATGAFSAGSSAVLMGKAFAQYRTGDGSLQDALNVMGTLVAQSLSLAASQTGGKAAEGLNIAAKAAPSALRVAGLASGDLVKAVREGDFPSLVKTLGTITKEVLSNLPGLQGQIDTLDSAIDLSQAGIVMAYKMAVNVRRGDLLAAFNGVIDDVSQNLESLLTLAGVDEGTTAKVVVAYQGSASASKAIQALAANPDDPSAALTELSGGLESVLKSTGNPVLAQIGAGMTVTIERLVSAKTVAGLVAKGQYDEALTTITTSLEADFSALMSQASAEGEGEDDEEGDDESGEGDDSGEGGESEAVQKRKLKAKERAKVSASVAEMVEQLKAGTMKVDPESAKKAAEAMEKEKQRLEGEEANEEARLLLEEAQLDLQSLSDAELTGAEASNIDNLIADLLRDRMIMKIATQIAQGGTAFLAKFVPGLGAVSAGVKLAAQLVAVAQRAKQLDAWIKSQKDLAAAQSALSSSAANFVKNQGQQLAHYSAQAFFAAAQLAGEITKLAGPAAPIGEMISSIAGASAKAEEMLMERKDKADIEKAWKVTLKSLRNPKNRQLALEARKLNPTLAKYSIAWGAVVLKDPLARNAMQACGLTEASLKNDSTDVNKVVEYLETFYEDDKSLYRDSTEPVPEWVPADPEVSLKWWGVVRVAATTKAQLVLSNTGPVEGLLGQLIAVREAVETSSDAVADQQNLFSIARQTALKTLESMGVDKPAPLPPPTEPVVEAMETHKAAVMRQYALLTQIASAYGACTMAAATPPTDGKENPNVKEMQAVLKQLAGIASDEAQVAQAEASGIETSKLSLVAAVEDLKRKAETKVKDKTGEKTGETAKT